MLCVCVGNMIDVMFSIYIVRREATDTRLLEI